MRFQTGFNKLSGHGGQGEATPAMAKSTSTKPVRFVCNIGLNDVAAGFPEAKDGDVMTIDDADLRAGILARGWAVEVEDEPTHKVRMKKQAE